MSKAALMETNEQDTAVQRAASGPARLIEFLKETRAEMRKVVTPTRSEVQATTIVVMVTVFLFAGYFELVDVIFGRGLDEILKHLVSH
jgi:preprotein translocase subunit SecE